MFRNYDLRYSLFPNNRWFYGVVLAILFFLPSNLLCNTISEEITTSIANWNTFMRNDLESLKLDGVAIFIRGIEEGNDFAKAVGSRNIGTYYTRTGNMSTGIIFLKKAATYFEIKGDALLSSETYNELGNAYYLLGDNEHAIAFFLKSIRIGRDSPDETSVFMAEPNLAQVFMRLGKMDRAKYLLQHYLKECSKRKKYEAISNAYSLLGTIAKQKGEVNVAMSNYRKSVYFGLLSGSLSQLGHALTNKAIVLFESGNVKQSYVFFHKALLKRKLHGDKRHIAEAYFNLAEFNFYQQKNTLASAYYDTCNQVYLDNKLYAEYSALQELQFERLPKNKIHERNEIIARLEFARKKMEKEIAITCRQDDHLFLLMEKEWMRRHLKYKKFKRLDEPTWVYWIVFLLLVIVVLLTISSFGEDKSRKMMG